MCAGRRAEQAAVLERADDHRGVQGGDAVEPGCVGGGVVRGVDPGHRDLGEQRAVAGDAARPHHPWLAAQAVDAAGHRAAGRPGDLGQLLVAAAGVERQGGEQHPVARARLLDLAERRVARPGAGARTERRAPRWRAGRGATGPRYVAQDRVGGVDEAGHAGSSSPTSRASRSGGQRVSATPPAGPASRCAQRLSPRRAGASTATRSRPGPQRRCTTVPASGAGTPTGPRTPLPRHPAGAGSAHVTISWMPSSVSSSPGCPSRSTPPRSTGETGAGGSIVTTGSAARSTASPAATRSGAGADVSARNDDSEHVDRAGAGFRRRRRWDGPHRGRGHDTHDVVDPDRTDGRLGDARDELGVIGVGGRIVAALTRVVAGDGRLDAGAAARPDGVIDGPPAASVTEAVAAPDPLRVSAPPAPVGPLPGCGAPLPPAWGLTGRDTSTPGGTSGPDADDEPTMSRSPSSPGSRTRLPGFGGGVPLVTLGPPAPSTKSMSPPSMVPGPSRPPPGTAPVAPGSASGSFWICVGSPSSGPSSCGSGSRSSSSGGGGGSLGPGSGPGGGGGLSFGSGSGPGGGGGGPGGGSTYGWKSSSSPLSPPTRSQSRPPTTDGAVPGPPADDGPDVPASGSRWTSRGELPPRRPSSRASSPTPWRPEPLRALPPRSVSPASPVSTVIPSGVIALGSPSSPSSGPRPGSPALGSFPLGSFGSLGVAAPSSSSSSLMPSPSLSGAALRPTGAPWRMSSSSPLAMAPRFVRRAAGSCPTANVRRLRTSTPRANP